MNRRAFLKTLLGSGMAASGLMLRTPWQLNSAKAFHRGEPPVLVVIFQRGGCDGLNTVVPYGEDEYYALRPTIGVAPPNIANPSSARPIDDPLRGHVNFFGLHPSMESLLPIYDAGELAVMPAVQYPMSSHSHFEGEVYIENGGLQSGLDGWLNRHMTLLPVQGGSLRSVHFGSSLAKSQVGAVPVQSFSFIDAFTLGMNPSDEAALIDTLLPVYQAEPMGSTAYQQLVHQYGQKLFSELDLIQSIDTQSYQPENGALYPATTYGRQLRETAQLIKEDLGVELITLDMGSWDTHSGQGGGEASGYQSRQLREFSQGISALYTDLGALMDNVIILTMTEFGRTAKENGSGGTDHGNASSWFMVGRNIQGGIHGAWPGLRPDQLAEERYLRFTVDYRDIFGDILLNHLGHGLGDIGNLLPDHTYQPLGLFS